MCHCSEDVLNKGPVKGETCQIIAAMKLQLLLQLKKQYLMRRMAPYLTLIPDEPYDLPRAEVDELEAEVTRMLTARKHERIKERGQVACSADDGRDDGRHLVELLALFFVLISPLTPPALFFGRISISRLILLFSGNRRTVK